MRAGLLFGVFGVFVISLQIKLLVQSEFSAISNNNEMIFKLD
jgi:hypothetical protein